MAAVLPILGALGSLAGGISSVVQAVNQPKEVKPPDTTVVGDRLSRQRGAAASTVIAGRTTQGRQTLGTVGA